MVDAGGGAAAASGGEFPKFTINAAHRTTVDVCIKLHLNCIHLREFVNTILSPNSFYLVHVPRMVQSVRWSAGYSSLG